MRNARFAVADVEQELPAERRFDRAFSRFGTMFFANPVAALRNVHAALVPGGELTMVVWRQRVDNEWLYRAQQIVEQLVTRPDEYDEPTCWARPVLDGWASVSSIHSTTVSATAVCQMPMELCSLMLRACMGEESAPVRWHRLKVCVRHPMSLRL